MTSRAIDSEIGMMLNGAGYPHAGPDGWRIDGDGTGGLLLVWDEATMGGPIPTDQEIKAAALTPAMAAAMARISAARDAALAEWLPASVTGETWLYSLTRRADYDGGLDRLERIDAKDPASAPHKMMYTVLDPSSGTPLQVPHTAAQLDALVDIGMAHIEAAWSHWHKLRLAIEAAATVAAIKAISWDAVL